MNHYYDLNPMGFNGECPTSGFPENDSTEPDEENPYYTTEFDDRVKGLTEAYLKERAKEPEEDRLWRLNNKLRERQEKRLAEVLDAHKKQVA